MNSQHATCGVLGAKGFVGSAVVHEARQRGYSVTPIDLQEYEAAKGSSFDILINANGNSRKYLAQADPKREFDLSVRSVLRSLHDFQYGHYIYLSTIDVYLNHAQPEANAESVTIDDTRLSPYGFHKFMAERLVRFYAKQWMIVRMGGFVGSGLWKNAIYDLLTRAPLRVHPDSQYQYLNSRDLAHILFDLEMSGSRNETWNVAGDGVLSLREAAAWIPDARLPAANSSLTKERYEVNISKLKARQSVPVTRTTVQTFIQNVLAGRESIR